MVLRSGPEERGAVEVRGALGPLRLWPPVSRRSAVTGLSYLSASSPVTLHLPPCFLAAADAAGLTPIVETCGTAVYRR